jgi:putative ABC transport system permease protein
LGRLAGDALSKNPGRTTYTVGALVLTLGMVVSVGAALGSYEAEVEAQAQSTFAAPLYVGARSFRGLGSDQPLSDTVEPLIENVDGVASAYPQRYVSIDIQGRQALLYAVPTLEAEQAGAGGRFTKDADSEAELVRGLRAGEVVVSDLTAKTHSLSTGDSITIPTPTGERAFEVAGTFSDLASFDSMYIDYATYRRYWKDDKVDRYAVLVDDAADVDATRSRLQAALDAKAVPATVLSKQELIDTILKAIRGLFSVARGIQIAALLIAVLTIANTMFTAVLERRWDSALCRALGMSPRQLRRSVLIEAGIIGVVGSAGAVVLGTLLGFAMTQIMQVQFSWVVAFRIPWALSLGAVLAGSVASVAAGALPSRSAAKASLIESLRYE